ncbi:MAG: PLD nuclease N-terminal domain-containing protein [Actinomycetaceae bacterium]|nr:PLD nuclease N-terminal domain-containing protein [Actinomycetaceae bacterium]
MARVVLLVLSFAITIYAMADCIRTPSEELPARLPKALWLLIVLLFTPIGGIAWIIISRVTQAEARGGQLNRSIWYSENPAVKFPSRQRTEAPINAPDNDPEFLWKLEKELQRKRQEEADAAGDTSESGDNTGSDSGGRKTSPASGLDETEPNAGAAGESGSADSGGASGIDELAPFTDGDPGEGLGDKPDDEPGGERPTAPPQSP